jgi:hypothetical protein
MDADSIPNGVSADVKHGDTQLAIFRIKSRYYTTQQIYSHKRAFVLSDGLIDDDVARNKLWVSSRTTSATSSCPGAAPTTTRSRSQRSPSRGATTWSTSSYRRRTSSATYEAPSAGWSGSGEEPFAKLDRKLGGKPNGLGLKGRKLWDDTLGWEEGYGGRKGRRH